MASRTDLPRRADPRDPAQGQARYRALRRAFGTLAIGAALGVAVFAGLGSLAATRPWLRATAAEGLVFAGAVLGLALVMAGLNYWYIGRPTAAALAGRSVPEPPPPGRPGPAAWGVLALSAAVDGGAGLDRIRLRGRDRRPPGGCDHHRPRAFRSGAAVLGRRRRHRDADRGGVHRPPADRRGAAAWLGFCRSLPSSRRSSSSGTPPRSG